MAQTMTDSPRPQPRARRRIAVIGAGIAGLGAAWALSRAHEVVLFEAKNRPGGHARTITVKTRGREVAVDTGFIVFNRVNYPNLCRLFDRLNVPQRQSNMSFAISVDGGAMEYGGRNLKRALAQPTNAMRPSFWRMVRDIAVFNRTALADSEGNPQWTLGDLIQRRRLGSWFERYYLLPMSGAIWSTSRARMRDFPACVLTRFFANHGLLSFSGHHRWWTVAGGSRLYVDRMLADMEAQLRLSAPAEAVTRAPDGVRVKAAGEAAERFDSVVFACHADTALALLKDGRADEKRILSQARFQRNRLVLHTDSRLMPRRRVCWSSWVYLASSRPDEAQASVTYWMNSLQGISMDTPLFATLNPSAPVADAHILDTYEFDHPQYDFGMMAAQEALPSIQGRGNVWYCGAWTKMGFHEDGLASALAVARQLGAPPPWEKAA